MFDGKADAVFSGLFRFRKAFFLHPQSEEVYGRVQLQKGPLGNVLYPLYFSCSIAPAIVPGTASPDCSASSPNVTNLLFRNLIIKRLFLQPAIAQAYM